MKESIKITLAGLIGLLSFSLLVILNMLGTELIINWITSNSYAILKMGVVVGLVWCLSDKKL